MVDDPLQLKLVVILQQEAGGTQYDDSLTGHLRRVLHHFLKFPQVGAREYFSLAGNRRRFIQKVVPIGNRDRRWQAIALRGLFERQSPGISRVPGIFEIESARGFHHFQRLVVAEVRAIMPRGGSASTGPEPGHGFMDLLWVRGKVGKHFRGRKDGYTVRRLEMSSKVVISSL